MWTFVCCHERFVPWIEVVRKSVRVKRQDMLDVELQFRAEGLPALHLYLHCRPCGDS